MEALSVFMQVGRVILDAFGLSSLITAALGGLLFLWLFEKAISIFRK